MGTQDSAVIRPTDPGSNLGLALAASLKRRGLLSQQPTRTDVTAECSVNSTYQLPGFGPGPHL
jgi:hypothetical protein